MSCINRWKRWMESCGPGEASGWYWTENTGHSLCVIPSIVWSFKFIEVTLIEESIYACDTANPWFWDVISTFPVGVSITGWFPPWCPNGSLNVFPFKARLKIWCPRQIPKIGILPKRNLTFWMWLNHQRRTLRQCSNCWSLRWNRRWSWQFLSWRMLQLALAGQTANDLELI